MRSFYFTVLFLLLMAAVADAATQRWVSNANDNQEEGTLRTVMQDACATPGDDVIGFWHTSLSVIRIFLKTPLVIPKECQGTVTMRGSTEVETILDGSQISGAGRLPGDTCTLNVYSDRHAIGNFTFSKNIQGAAVCLFGRQNLLWNLLVGSEKENGSAPNRFGIVIDNVYAGQFSAMDGSGNLIEKSVFGPQTANQFWIHADGTVIRYNTMHDAMKDGIVIAENGGQIYQNSITTSGGSGIYIAAGASNLTIGGPSAADFGNTIQNNNNGGVAFENSAVTKSITVTHNIISDNLGPRSNLDLQENGVSPNDLGDTDTGPNSMYNYVETMQAFPLSPVVGNKDYWLWGVAFDAKSIELYSVSPGDYVQSYFGGGGLWLLDEVVSGHTFSAISNDGVPFAGGMTVSALAFDAAGSTSEFSMSIPIGADKDLDGVLDKYEGNGTKGSLVGDPDSDDDGLPDSIEDVNRNGKWDIASGETCAYNVDSDGDGLLDWVETHGDGVYDPGEDTNPLIADTDGDGILDGDEDKNKDGVWEAYLGETSPLMKDSDSDGFYDQADTCPIIPNSGQEKWYCQLP